MISGKSSLEILRNFIISEGFEHLVISPGSRNAPLINAFCGHSSIKTTTIFDERSAGFFALGMAQRLHKPIAVACTSGTAVLNLAPAIAEAYYQKIPLLILTADRPKAWIDQGDGQTIRQFDIFRNYIRKSFELPPYMYSKDDEWYCSRLITEAIQLLKSGNPGPVHINMPFAEPLYTPLEKSFLHHNSSRISKLQQKIEDTELEDLISTWNSTRKIMILAGMMAPDPKLNKILSDLLDNEAVVVLTETTSNLNGNKFIQNIDRVLSTLTDLENREFVPELLITIGGQVISKRVKAWLRENKPTEHWHVHPVDTLMDTYQSLSISIPLQPEIFFTSLTVHTNTMSNYRTIWTEKDTLASRKHDEYLARCEYSDLLVFDRILHEIPEGSDIQLGNSSPVRYAQLFKYQKHFTFHSNRGTSGIDGTLSTAVGAAYANGHPTTIITGDLAFFYDSNFMLIPSLPANLRVIMINNGGGGIFRIIDGPSSTDHLETVFEARHQWQAELMVKNFGLPYYQATNIKDLENILSVFYNDHDNKPVVLEILTPTEKNAEILKEYFRVLSDL